VDLVLVTITLASVVVAAAMSLVAWRASREQRERSAARVAALAAGMDQPFDGPALRPPAEAVPLAWTDTNGGSGLFSRPEPERSTLARIAPALLVGVLIIGSVVGSAVMIGGSNREAVSASRERPLELLSLRHSVQDGSLSITGLVRNPAGNDEVAGVTAVVFLFDQKGSFLASGRSALDFSALAAGEESPFVVTMAAPPGVARYRVSFRRNEGGVISHLDRREARVP
jgi:hypothetical protein